VRCDENDNDDGLWLRPSTMRRLLRNDFLLLVVEEADIRIERIMT
jgi:hypothetical protein